MVTPEALATCSRAAPTPNRCSKRSGRSRRPVSTTCTSTRSGRTRRASCGSPSANCCRRRVGHDRDRVALRLLPRHWFGLTATRRVRGSRHWRVRGSRHLARIATSCSTDARYSDDHERRCDDRRSRGSFFDGRTAEVGHAPAGDSRSSTLAQSDSAGRIHARKVAISRASSSGTSSAM